MSYQPGHLYPVPFLGVTLPEHGLGRKAVHFPSSHYLTLAATGSGKLLTSAAHQLIGWPFDLIAVTPKEDLCNFALGRRTDPALFEDLGSARKGGHGLGVDPRGITNARFHLPKGRTINLDLGGSTAYPTSRYSFLSDIDVRQPGAMARLMAIARGLFPDQKPGAATDPYWQLAPQGAFSAVCGHVLTTESDPRKQSLVYATERLMGIDPATGASNPKSQKRLFKEMMGNPHLGGFIAAQGTELFQLDGRTFSSLISTLGTRVRWMLSDKRIRDVLSGPSDFSLEQVGKGPDPLSIFVTPARGDRSTDAFLRMFLELAVLMFQQRTWTPKNPVLVLADEIPQWGEEQVHMLRKALNVLRDKKIICWLYAQSYSQLLELLGEQGAADMISATTLQVFGVRDAPTLEMIRERLGRTRIKRRRAHGGSDSEEVFVADTDAIYDELSPRSPLQYVFPFGLRPARLHRASFVTTVTGEGLRAKGLNYEGHFDVGLPPFSP